MAVISFTVPDGQLSDFVDTMGEFWNYDSYAQNIIDQGGTPDSKGEFVRTNVINWLKARYRRMKKRLATDALVDENVDIT
jgi:hypothetical protein